MLLSKAFPLWKVSINKKGRDVAGSKRYTEKSKIPLLLKDVLCNYHQLSIHQFLERSGGEKLY